MRLRSMTCAALLGGALSACGGGESAPPQAAAEARDLAAAAPLPPPPAPVDTCAMLARTAVEQVIGALDAPPEAGAPQGSLLGECQYAKFSDGKMVTLSARPAVEFQATVDYAVKQGRNTPVEGLAGPGRITRAGLIFQPPGRPFFLVVLGVGLDDAALVALARAVHP